MSKEFTDYTLSDLIDELETEIRMARTDPPCSTHCNVSVALLERLLEQLKASAS